MRASVLSMTLVMVLAGCRDAPHAAPSGWQARVSAATVGPACMGMLGGTYRPNAGIGSRNGPPPSPVDLSDPAIPAAIRALGPESIEVDAEHVEIRMGHFTTRYADDEYDWYGLACFRTAPTSRYQMPGGATFLRSLGHDLYAFDSIL